MSEFLIDSQAAETDRYRNVDIAPINAGQSRRQAITAPRGRLLEIREVERHA